MSLIISTLCFGSLRVMQQPSALHAELLEASQWFGYQEEITEFNTIYHDQLLL